MKLRKKADPFAVSSEKEIKRNRTKDLKKFYKYVFICKFCGKKFGSDEKETQKMCPECVYKKSAWVSRFTR